MEEFPPQTLQGEFAVSFVGKLEPQQDCSEDALTQEGLDAGEQARQLAARRAVKGIAKLTVNRPEFDRQAAALQSSNPVYMRARYRDDIVALWCPEKDAPATPGID